MELSDQEYDKLVQEHAKSSPSGKNMLLAFLVGGAICTVGQVLGNFYQSRGLSQDHCIIQRLRTLLCEILYFVTISVIEP